MKIAVIILHYQNLSDTLECLDSLHHQDYSSFEIILIDNGSEDFQLEELVKNKSHVIFIKNKTNLGFAEGNNRGIQHALKRGADALLLLNNDTVSSPALLSTFAKAMLAHPDAAVFGAKIYYYDQPTVIWHAGGNVNSSNWRCFHEGCPISDLEKKWEEVREINYACGCALFIRKEAIEKVGLIAPDFFLIWEEIDWCWRIRKYGYRCLFIPEAKVWHKISRSFKGGNRSPQWQYYYFRNRLLFLKRNLPFSIRLNFYLTSFLRELIQILFFAFKPINDASSRELHRSALKGIYHYFLGRFGKES